MNKFEDNIVLDKVYIQQEYDKYLDILATKKEKDDSYWFMRGKFYMLNEILKHISDPLLPIIEQAYEAGFRDFGEVNRNYPLEETFIGMKESFKEYIKDEY